MNRKFLKSFLGIFVLGILLFNLCVTAQAKVINNLEDGKSYRCDLDEDGDKEVISYTLTEKKVCEIKVDGTVVKKIQMDEFVYQVCMQIVNVDERKKGVDIWLYAYGGSDDLFYSSLLEYSNGNITIIADSDDDNNFPVGYICGVKGKGKFSVAVPQLGGGTVAYLIGNHEYKVDMEKTLFGVKKVSKKTFTFHRTYGSNFGQSKWLITKKKLKFYKKASKSSAKVSLKKGTKCIPKKCVIKSSKYYVLFKTKSGKQLWLCANDFGYDKQAFKDIVLAG